MVLVTEISGLLEWVDSSKWFRCGAGEKMNAGSVFVTWEMGSFMASQIISFCFEDKDEEEEKI